jgi:hypothetical protein
MRSCRFSISFTVSFTAFQAHRRCRRSRCSSVRTAARIPTPPAAAAAAAAAAAPFNLVVETGIAYAPLTACQDQEHTTRAAAAAAAAAWDGCSNGACIRSTSSSICSGLPIISTPTPPCPGPLALILTPLPHTFLHVTQLPGRARGVGLLRLQDAPLDQRPDHLQAVHGAGWPGLPLR